MGYSAGLEGSSQGKTNWCDTAAPATTLKTVKQTQPAYPETKTYCLRSIFSSPKAEQAIPSPGKSRNHRTQGQGSRFAPRKRPSSLKLDLFGLPMTTWSRTSI